MQTPANRWTLVFAALAAGLVGGACGDETVADVSPDECASGKKWVGGNEESSLMRPGADCIGCHQSDGGPSYLVAGTVYPHDGLNDANDCFGLEGVSVIVEDADSNMWSLETNEAGNFFLKTSAGPASFPLTVRAENSDGAVAMTLPAESGACATCHTAQGLNAAAGRIIAPTPM